MNQHHVEPYVTLAGVTHEAALIAWGAFFFEIRHDGEFRLIEDEDLQQVSPGRRSSIGSQSECYDPGARVDIFTLDDRQVASTGANGTNHCWVQGLQPDSLYRYRVIVDGREWGAGPLRDWSVSDKTRMVDGGGKYRNTFRTRPAPGAVAPEFSFAVIGDFGTGVKNSSDSKRQREIADALRAAVEAHNVQLVLTTGDNIYARNIFRQDSGENDDDWFFTYFQPYRYIVNHVPVYPTVGNHDADETEDRDDRFQVYDNFYIRERIAGQDLAAASLTPGLFYTFKYGADIEFICLDTSREPELKPFDKRLVDHPDQRKFLDTALAAKSGMPRWRIAFCHHPVYCAGPNHARPTGMDMLKNRFIEGRIPVVFSGHEHNFQHWHTDGVHYFITGAAGKLSTGTPHKTDVRLTKSWAAKSHFLVATIKGASMEIHPYGELEDGRLARIRRTNIDGSVSSDSISLQAAPPAN